jgi:hypothetical protein
MANCDDLFQQIQALEQRKRDIEKARYVLNSQRPPEDPDPATNFVFRDRTTGQELETNFNQMWRDITVDPERLQEWAARAAGSRSKPIGSDGEFENFAQMVDRMGVDSAVQLGSMLQALTGDWAKYSPSDFNVVTAINDKEAFQARLLDAFEEAGIAVKEDLLGQAIAQNVAPFLGILNNGTKAQVFADITRSNVISKMQDIADTIGETGLPPSREAKAEFVDAYIKALFAHRSLRVAKRRSGQLLQQWQRVMGEDLEMPGSIWEQTGAEAKVEVGQIAEELIAATPADLVGPDSIAAKVVDAANKGPSGQLELTELIDAAKVDGIDPLAKLDKGWDWKAQARGYYKDSILFAPKTQVAMNYMSQKLVFIAEGLKKAAGNGPLIREGATSFHRDLLKSNIEGARAAAEAAMRAEEIIKQSWSESLRKGFFNAEAPFAGNPDAFGVSTGAIPIEEQYKIAQQVLADPWDAKRLPIQIRDKWFVSEKLLTNYLQEKALSKMAGREIRLPITDSLQMLGAVDQRAGLRVYMTDRANDFFIQSFKDGPEWSWAQRRQYVDQKLQDVLYTAEPSDAQIANFRKQYDLGEEFSNDQIAAYIASEKVGVPVLADPGNRKSWDFSQYARMQNRPQGGIGQLADDAMRPIRKNDYFDMLISFWRSPWNQALWDMSLGAPPIANTARIVGKIRAGEEIPPQLLAATQAAWVMFGGMVAMFASLDNEMGKLTGSAPLDAQKRAAWKTAGNRENSVFGIPLNLGGLPVLNTLFLWKDLKEAMVTGMHSKWDMQQTWWQLMQVGTGQIMRQTGFRSLQMLSEALTERTPEAFQRLAGFIANGQVNPFSGPLRSVEGVLGLGADTVQRNRKLNPSDAYLVEQIGRDDQLEQMREGLQAFLINFSPMLSALAGATLKETDYLGRNITPWNDWIFKNEYPAGVPMHWNAENKVYSTLNRLGLLQPPDELMTGRMHGVPLDRDAEKEFNYYVGFTRGGKYSDHPLFGGKTLYRVPGKVDYMVENSFQEQTVGIPVDLSDLLDRATNGKTLFEASNYVINSSEFKRWEANPATTTDPRVKDMPATAYREQPGPWVLAQLRDYYAALARERMETSDSKAAAEMRALRAERLKLQSIESAERKAAIVTSP